MFQRCVHHYINYSSTIRTDDVHFGKCLITCSLQYSRRPLHLAAERRHTDVVNIFIKHGANLDTKDWVIDTCIYALLHACTVLQVVYT